jgi:tripartite-type tricarboxylate transporter receptor subunit TctC
MATLPGVPTLDEAGLKGFEVDVWHGVYAPKATPKPAIDKLTNALQDALKDSNVKQRFSELGAEPVSLDRATPQALEKHLKAEIEKWSPIIKKAGVYAE